MSNTNLSVPDYEEEDFSGTSQVMPAWVPDDANEYDYNYDYTLPSLVKPRPHALSTSTSDSSQTLAFSSKLSHPSGLPVDAIAGLTHDELMLNAEFVQYVSLVGSLQNLINLWSTGQLAKFGEFPLAPHLITYFHLLTLFLQLSLSVLQAPCVQASWHLKSLVPLPITSCLFLARTSVPMTFHLKSSGLGMSARATQP